jgi:Flp pilus assembly pilin Flp
MKVVRLTTALSKHQPPVHRRRIMGVLTLVAQRAHLLFTSLEKTERGASLVVYALLVALNSIVSIAAMSTFGGAVDSNFSSASEVL